MRMWSVERVRKSGGGGRATTRPLPRPSYRPHRLTVPSRTHPHTASHTAASACLVSDAGRRRVSAAGDPVHQRQPGGSSRHGRPAARPAGGGVPQAAGAAHQRQQVRRLFVFSSFRAPSWCAVVRYPRLRLAARAEHGDSSAEHDASSGRLSVLKQLQQPGAVEQLPPCSSLGQCCPALHQPPPDPPSVGRLVSGVPRARVPCPALPASLRAAPAPRTCTPPFARQSGRSPP
jgi:hypothetical protein